MLLYDGTRFTARRTDDREYDVIERMGDRRSQIYRPLRRLRDEHADLIRERYPDIPRRVSGLQPRLVAARAGFDLAGFLVGSESTLVTILRAELELVPVVKHRTLVVLGFDGIAEAADAVPAIVEHEPIALEGVDEYLIHDERIKGMNPQALGELPKGSGFLLVQFGGDTTEEADQRAHAMLNALGETDHDPDVAFMDDPTREDELWQVREAGLGATAHVPHRPDTLEGWEDSAVPVDRLGDYLRDLSELYEEFGYASTRAQPLRPLRAGLRAHPDPVRSLHHRGRRDVPPFLERAADLVVSYGGSLSGEHGDGQTRGELLPRMFGDEVVAPLRARSRRSSTRDDRMNPGKVVHPAPLDVHLRLGGTGLRRTEAAVLRLPRRRPLVPPGRQPLRRASASAASTRTTAAP